MKHPLLLIVLDGWGHRDEVASNAILPNSPYFQDLQATYPHSLLVACGREVGLPLGVMGNSEVGHMSLGAGRVVRQEISRIDHAIEQGEFFENGALTALMDRVSREGKNLHLLGLVSDGKVHSSDHHLRKLLELCARRGLASNRVFVHAMTDGRDTPPRSGIEHLERLEQALAGTGVGRIASVLGRYWGMDRDQRWDRVARAYHLLVSGEGATASSAQETMRRSYDADVTDEFVEPTVIGPPDEGRIAAGDGLILFNYRADRVREICEALSAPDFSGFERHAVVEPEIVTFTQYREDFPFAVAFPPTDLTGTFPELVSRAGLTQKRIAETEKYAHVTFFFSGGEERPYAGEERILVPSPKVATYDLQPEMSSGPLTDAILESLRRDETDVYVINFAGADMVGHTGDFEAASQAVRAIDACLKRIVPEVLRRGGVAAITADHGNSEMLWDAENNQPHTAHTLNPVPIVFCSSDLIGAKIRSHGVLADVAPSLLELLKLERSEGMDGLSLFEGGA